MPEENVDAPRRGLLIALILNLCLTAALLITGLLAQSTALIANALDNGSDAAVYGISLYAVKRDQRWKIRAAQLSGVMLLLLSAGVLLEAVRRFFSGTEPIGTIMVVMSVFATIVNILCLKLLSRHRSGGVDLRAAWTFSVNDLVSNFGVLVAGILVAVVGRPWPDLVIAGAISMVAAKGGIGTILDARRTSKEQSRGSAANPDEGRGREV